MDEYNRVWKSSNPYNIINGSGYISTDEREFHKNFCIASCKWQWSQIPIYVIMYNCTVRHSFQACYNCPHNLTDCARPHCVAGDGQRRQFISINRQLPGPKIEVRKTQVQRMPNTMTWGGRGMRSWESYGKLINTGSKASKQNVLC